MGIFDAIALLLVASAAAAYVNHRLFRLPHTIGVALAALVGSNIVLIIDAILPHLALAERAVTFVNEFEFADTLLHGMLSFLLFAGALHLDMNRLAQHKWPIALLATVGVVISTFVVGTITYFCFDLIGHPLPFIWALAFGALISPTDPVATLGMLRSIAVPPSIAAQIGGESLFNDGVGVVVYIVIIGIIVNGAGATAGATALIAVETFAHEAVGGAALGFACGWIVFRGLRKVDDHVVEILLTLALASGVYALAAALHLSAPIAVVVAGLLIGNRGVTEAMSKHTRDNLLRFWELLEKMLNSVLFLLIGMEAVRIGLNTTIAMAGAIAIVAMLIGRSSSVLTVATLLRRQTAFTPGAAPALIWGGLRGGISVALALTLPESEVKPLLLAATYIAVVFSIIVQGLTLQGVLKRAFRGRETKDEGPLPRH